MESPVKREYSSSLRATQARQTRRLIVAAAARLFVADGYGATTIDAIAAAAGVGRNTVFAAAGGKGELLKLALEWAQVGDDEPIPLAQRPVIAEIGRQTDSDAIIAGFVQVIADIGARVCELSQVLIVAAGMDEQMKVFRQERVAQRWEGARAFIRHLADHGGLLAELDLATAADIAWLYSDPGLYFRLVIERYWPTERFSTWLHRTLTGQLCPPKDLANADSGS